LEIGVEAATKGFEAGDFVSLLVDPDDAGEFTDNSADCQLSAVSFLLAEKFF
jgi:hypothetical protein